VDGWKDQGTLWGVASCKPVELAADGTAVYTWEAEACAGIAPAPDGRTIAWSDGTTGRVLVGQRGRGPRVVRAPDAQAPAGEGDPAGELLWSPDGSRLLLAWAAEWESSFAVARVEGGSLEPIATRLDGFYLSEAWGWLDVQRILFSAQASRDARGRSEYSESGGYRSDLTVYDLRDSSYVKVTAAADGVMLRPLARWGTSEVLVGERERGATRYERYWAYDPVAWSRRPVPLPAVSDVRVFDPTRVLLLDRRSGDAGAQSTRVFLWRADAPAVEPLVELRNGSLAWSPDGRRIAVTTSEQVPVEGMPGSFRERQRAYVLEPR
jgi:hypothetical protein